MGTPEWNIHVRKEVAMVFSYKSFRHWTPTRTEYNADQRRIDRDSVINALKATELSLFSLIWQYSRRSNPRGTAGRTESGSLNTIQRGRLMGLGTPSIAPEQAKGVVPRAPQRVENSTKIEIG